MTTFLVLKHRTDGEVSRETYLDRDLKFNPVPVRGRSLPSDSIPFYVELAVHNTSTARDLHNGDMVSLFVSGSEDMRLAVDYDNELSLSTVADLIDEFTLGALDDGDFSREARSRDTSPDHTTAPIVIHCEQEFTLSYCPPSSAAVNSSLAASPGARFYLCYDSATMTLKTELLLPDASPGLRHHFWFGRLSVQVEKEGRAAEQTRITEVSNSHSNEDGDEPGAGDRPPPEQSSTSVDDSRSPYVTKLVYPSAVAELSRDMHDEWERESGDSVGLQRRLVPAAEGVALSRGRDLEESLSTVGRMGELPNLDAEQKRRTVFYIIGLLALLIVLGMYMLNQQQRRRR